MRATELRELVEENFSNDLYGFVEGEITRNGKSNKQFLIENNLEFVENNDQEAYDSYGHEDTVLERIYLHTPTETYFMVYGTRQSYEGTEWDGIKEVNRTQKVITVWQ